MVMISRGKTGEKGTWTVTLVQLRNNESYKVVMVSCPECGRDISISGRVITKDGEVGGTIACHRDGCGWSDEVMLLDWTTTGA